MKIIFLHNSIGKNVRYGDVKQKNVLNLQSKMPMVPRLLKEHYDKNYVKISIEERYFPSEETYS